MKWRFPVGDVTMTAMTPTVDILLRGGVFALAALLLLLREWRVPAFGPALHRVRRRVTNLAMAIVGVGVTRWLAPAGLAGVAAFAAHRNWGLLPALNVPEAVAGVAGVLVLDATVYWQHRLMHRVPLLWRLHAVHHADPRIDVTTAVRFHPAELALSLAPKSAVVLMLGCPVWAAAGFEVLLAVSALFNHANTRFGRAVEGALRRILIVTPALHRVHHALDRACQDRNFGFSTTLWDRLFGTYREPETLESPVIRFGLVDVDADRASGVGPMLLMPVRGVNR